MKYSKNFYQIKSNKKDIVDNLMLKAIKKPLKYGYENE